MASPYMSPVREAHEDAKRVLGERDDRTKHFFGAEHAKNTHLPIPKYIWQPTGIDPDGNAMAKTGLRDPGPVLTAWWRFEVLCHGKTEDAASALWNNLISALSSVWEGSLRVDQNTDYVDGRVVSVGAAYIARLAVLGQVDTGHIDMTTLLEPEEPTFIVTSIDSTSEGTTTVVETP